MVFMEFVVFFYYRDAKLLFELTQHDLEDISLWFTGHLNVQRQKDFIKEVCIMLRNVGIAITSKDFQQYFQVNSLVEWNGMESLQ